MDNQNNGQLKSGPLSANDKATKITDYLDSWENSIGLSQFTISSVENEAIQLLSKGTEERKKMSPYDAGHAAVTLSQFAAYIGRLCQKEEARMAWATDEIHKTVASRLSQQKAYSFQEKLLLAVAENEHAQNLERHRGDAQAKSTRLKYLANRIEKVAEAYKNLSSIFKREMQAG